MGNKGIADKCPHCGFAESLYQQNLNHLPLRTVLYNRYIIGKALGQGGFGVTYIAWDTKLNIPMAIKEYLPLNLAGRSAGSVNVSAHSEEKEASFKHHLEKFLQEARILAKFNNEKGIVSVQDIFEENATIYIVMFYVNGETLEKHMQRQHRTYSFQETMLVMGAVMEALSKIHNAGLIHRDISPDNIYITTDNQVKLLDFGAAKYTIMEEEKSVSVILKRGYAPFEQYSGRKKLGPWSDVYSVAATMYRMMTGEIPPEAADRIINDNILLPSAYGIDLPDYAEAALMKALAVEAECRFQTMDEFIQALEAGNQVNTQLMTFALDNAEQDTTVSQTGRKVSFARKRSGILKIIAVCATVLIIFLIAAAYSLDIPAGIAALRPEKLILMTSVSEAEEKVLIDCTKADIGIDLSIQNYDKKAYNPVEYVNYIKLKLASEDVPDLFVLPVGSYRNGTNAPDTLLDLAGEDFIRDVSKVYKDYASSEGRIYSVPNGPAFLNAWLYNRKVYDKLGLFPPETWDELLSNCEAIKNSGRVPIVAPFKDVWTSYIYYYNAFYYMEVEDPQLVKGIIDNSLSLQTKPGFIKALSNLQTLSNKGYFNKDSNETDYSKGIDDFANGKAVHFPMGAWVLGNLNAYYGNTINDIGMFAMPWDNQGPNGISADMPLGLCIYKNTEHRESSLKFLKYYISRDTVNKLKVKLEGSGDETFAFAGIPLIRGYEFPEGTIPAIKDEVAIINSGNVKAQLTDEVFFFNEANNIAQIIVDVANDKTTPKDAAGKIDKELKKAANLGSVRVK